MSTNENNGSNGNNIKERHVEVFTKSANTKNAPDPKNVAKEIKQNTQQTR